VALCVTGKKQVVPTAAGAGSAPSLSLRSSNRPPVRQDLTKLISTRGGQPADAPSARALPRDGVYGWEHESVGYAPVEYIGKKTAGRIEKGLPGFHAECDPTAEYETWTGKIIAKDDHTGRPLNPTGRTGYAGLGSCSFYGPNLAADPVVTRDGRHGPEVLLIQRGDTGEWAIPGGKVDAGEETWDAAARELSEESGVDVDFSEAATLYQGYVDDPRNTDHAWFETTALHVHVDGETALQEPEGQDDAVSARWVSLNDDTIASAYSDHGAYLRAALETLR
jgi:ADP-ribose pyrophosphatase